ncbi:MAG: hypothetical protein B7Z66_05050 [Chromatiales bacterium 21-64-14]|nr:MAG: hypothetical protein B7Z66_05050 [Chromatiales bacterium 21-64-14]HQU16470.1 DUF2914 domain-containing protein [Gammaproteobacteria bacterium]
MRFAIGLIAGLALCNPLYAAGPVTEAAPVTKPAPAVEPAVPVPAAPAGTTVAPEAAVTGRVERAQFTTAIHDREPVDAIKRLTRDTGRVYFFTDVRGMAGGMVIHRWIHNGAVVASVPFQIKGPRWRVWSSKRLQPQWAGTWKVEVVNGAGRLLDQATLDYAPTAPPVDAGGATTGGGTPRPAVPPTQQ